MDVVFCPSDLFKSLEAKHFEQDFFLARGGMR